MELFNDLEKIIDKEYKDIPCYKIEDSIFFIEPNFYTQLMYAKDHFENKFPEIIEAIKTTALKNKKVIFTGDFDQPVVYRDGFIYRDIGDVLGSVGLYFDNKSNPDSDWKD